MHRSIALPVAALVAIFTTLLAAWSLHTTISAVRGPVSKHYSYETLDFPENFQLPPLGRVKLAIEDSVHFDLSGEQAEAEWDSIFPLGGGFVQLGSGPHKRNFTISMFHQLRCIQSIRYAIIGRAEDSVYGVDHCFNYLRQMILCHPDYALERQSDFLRDERHRDGVDGLGMVHTCWDWTSVYEAVEQNFAQTAFL